MVNGPGLSKGYYSLWWLVLTLDPFFTTRYRIRILFSVPAQIAYSDEIRGHSVFMSVSCISKVLELGHMSKTITWMVKDYVD